MLKLKGKLLALTLKAVLTILVVLVPVLGVWFASSLAAYFNGPTWLVAVCGLLLFPIVPLLWDWWATARWKKKKRQKEQKGANNPELEYENRGRILVFWDRLILRTFAINMAFLMTLGWAVPEKGFTALSARGDWMLEDVEAPWTEPVEEALFRTAEGLEFLYHHAHDNPFHEYADEDTPSPEPDEGGDFTIRDQDPEDGDRSAMSWPPPDELHPVVEEMPASAETSIESVADHIARHESDPFYRVKALFDYVADRITYDHEALEAGEYPPQDAETVFETGRGVCAGYARLLIALGEETGDEIVYVTGVSRDNEGEVGGAGHAWNAARIEGSWYLMDPTWASGDSGTDDDPDYNSVYLFTPPEVLITTHFPDDESWQLLDRTVSRGEFVRQPVLRPDFYARGLELLEPTRSQENVGSTATLVVDNPDEHRLRGRLVDDSNIQKRCTTSHEDRETVIECSIPSEGAYHVQLFGDDGSGGNKMWLWGQVEVHGG